MDTEHGYIHTLDIILMRGEFSNEEIIARMEKVGEEKRIADRK